MRSFTSIVSFLALGGAAVSAMNLFPALPRPEGMSLGKRDVECSGDVYCLDGYTCMTGSDGVPGCCPRGEKCSGPGAIETVVATNTVAVERTSFSTYVYVTTGVYTGGPEPTTTSTPDPDYDSTTTTSESESESETETSSSTSTDEEEYESTTSDADSTEPTGLYTTMEGNATTTRHRNGTTRHGNETSATHKPVAHEAGAAGMVVNVGIAGVIAAVVGLLMV